MGRRNSVSEERERERERALVDIVDALDAPIKLSANPGDEVQRSKALPFRTLVQHH